MKNMLFVISHLYSGSEDLIPILNQNPRIDIKNFRLSYDHPLNLEYVFSAGHKLDNSAAIYGDVILFNKDFSSKEFYKFCKFIYVIREPRPVLNELLVKNKHIDELRAARYYCFRLRRIYEIARAAGGILLWDDFSRNRSLLEDYLQLREPLDFSELNIEAVDGDLSTKTLKICQDCYEKYLFLMRKSLVQ